MPVSNGEWEDAEPLRVGAIERTIDLLEDTDPKACTIQDIARNLVDIPSDQQGQDLVVLKASIIMDILEERGKIERRVPRDKSDIYYRLSK